MDSKPQKDYTSLGDPGVLGSNVKNKNNTFMFILNLKKKDFAKDLLNMCW